MFMYSYKYPTYTYVYATYDLYTIYTFSQGVILQGNIEAETENFIAKLVVTCLDSIDCEGTFESPDLVDPGVIEDPGAVTEPQAKPKSDHEVETGLKPDLLHSEAGAEDEHHSLLTKLLNTILHARLRCVSDLLNRELSQAATALDAEEWPPINANDTFTWSQAAIEVSTQEVTQEMIQSTQSIDSVSKAEAYLYLATVDDVERRSRPRRSRADVGEELMKENDISCLEAVLLAGMAPLQMLLSSIDDDHQEEHGVHSQENGDSQLAGDEEGEEHNVDDDEALKSHRTLEFSAPREYKRRLKEQQGRNKESERARKKAEAKRTEAEAILRGVHKVEDSVFGAAIALALKKIDSQLEVVVLEYRSKLCELFAEVLLVAQEMHRPYRGLDWDTLVITQPTLARFVDDAVETYQAIVRLAGFRG